MAAFHFRAVAPDGKLRTGTLNADTEERRDVLLFTHELSTLLKAGVPLTAQEVMRVTQEF